jgi:hypothetical protein
MSVAAGSNGITNGLVLDLDGAYIGLTTTVDVLLVAGGGGGGMDMGGGGGGGGVLYTTSNIVHGTTYAVVVGAGGYGAPAGSGGYRTDGAGPQPGSHQYTISATNGGNSTFNGLTAIGGGYGGSSYFGYTPNYGYGNSGGSGGGASGYSDGNTGHGGAATSGQGNVGGGSGGQYYSGGGGGAGAAGTTGPSQPHGGAGICYPTMSPYYFGGGGGGAAYSLTTGGNGGIGGGGGGAIGQNGVIGGIGGLAGASGIAAGVNGTQGPNGAWGNVPGGNGGTNTGGGGGGGSHYNANNKGGEGGSGIVIIRYLGGQRATGGVVSSQNGYTIHTFLANGTFDTTAWIDKSGTGNTGTLVNGPTYSSANGGVIVTDGIDDYITLNSLNLSTGAYTIIAAVRYSGSTRGRIITATNNNWLMGHWSSTTENYYAEGWVSASSSGANDTNWRILAATGDTNTDVWQMYVNGVLTFQNNGGSAGPNGLSISGYSEKSTSETGFVLAYNRVLTATEIKQNFNAYRARFGI